MELKKVKIESFTKAECTSATKIAEIEAFINPTQYSTSLSLNFTEVKIPRASEKNYVFANYGDEKLDIGEIIVDGTGLVRMGTNNKDVDGNKNHEKGYSNKDVDGYIQKFKGVVCDYLPLYKRPPYLKITWTTLSVICFCESFNVTYTLFKPDGTPLRAKIKLGLIRSDDFETKKKQAAASSAEQPSVRTATAGDSLALMTYQVYGTTDSTTLAKVARANNLNQINGIKPGDQIYFPSRETLNNG